MSAPMTSAESNPDSANKNTSTPNGAAIRAIGAARHSRGHREIHRLGPERAGIRRDQADGVGGHAAALGHEQRSAGLREGQRRQRTRTTGHLVQRNGHAGATCRRRDRRPSGTARGIEPGIAAERAALSRIDRALTGRHRRDDGVRGGALLVEQPECEHTKRPEGFVAFQEWAEKKAKTHDQIRCPVCGLWAVWVPKTTR